MTHKQVVSEWQGPIHGGMYPIQGSDEETKGCVTMDKETVSTVGTLNTAGKRVGLHNAFSLF